MKIYKTKKELQEKINSLRKSGASIGFVPTMGALHKGHLSLINCSKQECDITVVSIFVNPTQFNDKSDLKKYPRMPVEDIKKLQEIKTDILFMPDEKEMYPEKDTRVFDFGHLDKVMEGKNRPGHFNGVAQIVSKLFDIVNPHKAFFGKKDFQQVAIIKALVKQLNYNIDIIPCEIVREDSGLAMSSRNLRLSKELREEAANIYKTLREAVKLSEEKLPDEVIKFVEKTINKFPNLNLEYFEIVENDSLLPVNDWSKNNITGCIVVNVGDVRLIDNIAFK